MFCVGCVICGYTVKKRRRSRAGWLIKKRRSGCWAGPASPCLPAVDFRGLMRNVVERMRRGKRQRQRQARRARLTHPLTHSLTRPSARALWNFGSDGRTKARRQAPLTPVILEAGHIVRTSPHHQGSCFSPASPVTAMLRRLFASTSKLPLRAATATVAPPTPAPTALSSVYSRLLHTTPRLNASPLPIPHPRPDISTPIQFLKAISYPPHRDLSTDGGLTALMGEGEGEWNKLWELNGQRLRKAGVPIKHRR